MASWLKEWRKECKREGQGTTSESPHHRPHWARARPASTCALATSAGGHTHTRGHAHLGPRPRSAPAPPSRSPAVLSLSRIRKEPCVFPGARSCRSASLRLRFLKNQLPRTQAKAVSCWPVPPRSRSRIHQHPQDPSVLEIPRSAPLPPPRRVPTHGSGSRLFALATKLKGMKPSWPVVRDCAFHHSPLLRHRQGSVRTPGYTRPPPHPLPSTTPPLPPIAPPTSTPDPAR